MRRLAGIVLIVEEKILLVLPYKHRKKYGKRKWSIPKGKIDCGETAFEAAQRELKEECGISLKKLGLEEEDFDYQEELGYNRKGKPAKLQYFVYYIPKIKLTSIYMNEDEIAGFGLFDESVARDLIRPEQTDLVNYLDLNLLPLSA